MDWLLLVIGAFLLLVSIIDWKLKVIPSILLTSMLFAVAFLNPANLWFGIMAFIVAYLLYEMSYFEVADIKVMTMLGFLVNTTNWFFALVVLTVAFGLVWITFVKYRLKKEKGVAFLPVFFFVYVALHLLGGIN